MTREQVTRGNAVRLLKRLLDQINAITADGGDTTPLRARYRAAGDAIVDGHYGEAKLILAAPHAPPASPKPAGTVIKVTFVEPRGIKAGRR